VKLHIVPTFRLKHGDLKKLRYFASLETVPLYIPAETHDLMCKKNNGQLRMQICKCISLAQYPPLSRHKLNENFPFCPTHSINILRNCKNLSLKGPTGQIRLPREWYHWKTHDEHITKYLTLDLNFFLYF